MIFAVAGGIVWFFQQRLLALVLWGVAGIIILKLNRQKKRSPKSKNKYRWLVPIQQKGMRETFSYRFWIILDIPLNFLLTTIIPMIAMTRIVTETAVPNSGTTWVPPISICKEPLSKSIAYVLTCVLFFIWATVVYWPSVKTALFSSWLVPCLLETMIFLGFDCQCSMWGWRNIQLAFYVAVNYFDVFCCLLIVASSWWNTFLTYFESAMYWITKDKRTTPKVRVCKILLKLLGGSDATNATDMAPRIPPSIITCLHVIGIFSPMNLVVAASIG